MNATRKILATATAFAALLVLLSSVTPAPVPSSPVPAPVPSVRPVVQDDKSDESTTEREEPTPPLRDLRILGALLLAGS